MTSRIYLSFAVLFLCRACFAQVPSSEPTVSAAPPNANAELKLDDATPVFLHTKAQLCSATAKEGDPVAFRVTEDVKAGDLIAIRRGADAWVALEGSGQEGGDRPSDGSIITYGNWPACPWRITNWAKIRCFLGLVG